MIHCPWAQVNVLGGRVGNADALLHGAVGRVASRSARRRIFVQAAVIALAARRLYEASTQGASRPLVLSSGEREIANVRV